MSFEFESDALWFQYAWAIGAIIVGAVVAIGSVLAERRSRRAATEWIPTPAKVLRTGARRSNEVWLPEVWYRYVIDGAEYESANLSGIETGWSSRRSALRRARVYKPTEQVTVYVNPNDHKEAFLQPGPQPLAMAFGVGGGLLFVSIGTWKLLHLLGLVPGGAT